MLGAPKIPANVQFNMSLEVLLIIHIAKNYLDHRDQQYLEMRMIMAIGLFR